MNALDFALAIALAAHLLRHYCGPRAPWAIWFVLTGVPIVYVALMALSEMLFVTCALACLAALTLYHERGVVWALALAAGLAALASLVRYVGLAPGLSDVLIRLARSARWPALQERASDYLAEVANYDGLAQASNDLKHVAYRVAIRKGIRFRREGLRHKVILANGAICQARGRS